MNEVADFYKVTPRAIRYWVSEGKIDAEHVLGRKVVRASTLLDLTRAGMRQTPPHRQGASAP